MKNFLIEKGPFLSILRYTYGHLWGRTWNMVSTTN